MAQCNSQLMCLTNNYIYTCQILFSYYSFLLAGKEHKYSLMVSDKSHRRFDESCVLSGQDVQSLSLINVSHIPCMSVT